MSKRRSSINVPPHILELIRVTPEMTQEALAKVKTKPTPPEQSGAKRKSKKQLYCPYCAQYRKFKARQKNGYLTYRRCTSCGISNEDFYVKTYNKLW